MARNPLVVVHKASRQGRGLLPGCVSLLQFCDVHRLTPPPALLLTCRLSAGRLEATRGVASFSNSRPSVRSSRQRFPKPDRPDRGLGKAADLVPGEIPQAAAIAEGQRPACRLQYNIYNIKEATKQDRRRQRPMRRSGYGSNQFLSFLFACDKAVDYPFSLRRASVRPAEFEGQLASLLFARSPIGWAYEH
jgi:hypothetical protein